MAKNNSDGLSEGNETGYGKPPRHAQFQKGKSGNPGGRPRKPTSFAAAVRAVGDRTLLTTLDGVPTRVDVLTAMATNLMKKGLEGNIQAVKLIDEILSRPQPPADPEVPERISFTLVLEDPKDGAPDSEGNG